MSIGVEFVLRATTSGFTKGLATAENSVKDLKKSLKEFDVGNGFKQALGVGGIIAGFRMAINNAQELRDEANRTGRAVSDSVRSVAAYGDALDEAWKGVKNLSTETLSYFTKAGEGWGMLINRLRGVSREQENIAANAAKGAKEQEEAAAKLYQEKSQRAKTVDSDIASQERKNEMDGLTAEQKRLKLLKERTDLLDKIDAMAPENKDPAFNVARKEAQLKAARLTGEINDLGRGIYADAERERDREKEKEAKKMKEVVEKFAPSVEQLSNMNAGGFASQNDPRLRAKKILQTEQFAAEAGSRGDIANAIKLGKQAQGMRDSLEGVTGKGTALTAETAETALKNALTQTNKELEQVREQLRGLIKAQK